MYTAGIDIGSSNIKTALWNGLTFDVWSQPTGWEIESTSQAAIQTLLERSSLNMGDISHIVATGYGRKMCGFAERSVTEITCHAAGASFMINGAETVLDIGGQDIKVITMDRDGKVTDFLMNDKCAAGTGRFLSNMAVLLGYSLKDFSEIPDETEIQTISSMCTVFAESEVISLLARGIQKQNIALGLLDSIALRAAGMVDRLSSSGSVVMTGGPALNKTLASLISKHLGRPVLTPEMPQHSGAIGAALIAAKRNI
ncbi:MAG: acyl-CoA dehydratase activase [Synergistaceae bacterium]|nr:acyl-CoA dehydratase activase [Synergistaceae bacterium]